MRLQTTKARTGLMKQKRSKNLFNNDDAIIVTIQEIVIMNSHNINQRQISRELNVSPATVYRILPIIFIYLGSCLHRPNLPWVLPSLAGTP